MQNRWGVDVRKGHTVRFHLARGGQDEEKVQSIKREAGRGYVVTLESGRTVALDDVSLSLGPMTVGRGGVVRQNPDAVHIDIGSHNGGRDANPAADFWHVFDAHGKVIARDLPHKTALGALKRIFPGVHVYSHGQTGNGRTVSYAIDAEPRHVFVTKDADFDLRRSNPTPRLDHWEQASQRAHAGPRGGLTKKPTKRLIQRRLKTHHQPLPGVWANPLVNVKVKSPAQRGKAAPSERLMNRRKTTEKAPKGFYANPGAFLYCVWRMDANGQPAYFMRAERSLKAAKEYAQSLADKAGTPYGIIKKPL